MALISNQPLREAFVSSGMTRSELGHKLGYQPATAHTMVGRALGLMPLPARSVRSGASYYQTQVQEKTALRFAQALGLNSDDVGL